MKKSMLSKAFVLIVSGGLLTIVSCKKGDNDPFLSLKSRKARITGEWKLDEGTVTRSQSWGGITDYVVTTYTSTSATEDLVTFSYSETLEIEKDGTYKVTIVEDGETVTISGNWFFAKKSKEGELKNKEAIVLSETQYTSSAGTTTYTGLYADQTLVIDQLKNKEMIFKGSYWYSDSDNYSSTTTYDRTFTKEN